MQVLDYEFSERFDKLYRSVRRKLKRKIVFYPIDQHPSEYVRDTRGAHYIDEMTVSVFINTEKLESTEAEITAAEDMVYALIRAVEKFPFALANTELDEEKLFEAEVIAGTITASVHHLTVLARLKERGFWIQAVQEKDTQELVNMMSVPGFQEPPAESLPFYNFTMKYIETNFYEEIDKKEVMGLFQLKTENIIAAGETGVEIIKRYGYDTPKKCMNTMVDLRDMLQLQDKVWIMNAETELVF